MSAEPTPEHVHNQARQEVLGELRDTFSQMPVHDEAAPESVTHPELAVLGTDTRAAVKAAARELFDSDASDYQEQIRQAAEAKRTEQARRKAGSRLRRLNSGLITDYRYRLDAETKQILDHDGGLNADQIELAVSELKRAQAKVIDDELASLSFENIPVGRPRSYYKKLDKQLEKEERELEKEPNEMDQAGSQSSKTQPELAGNPAEEPVSETTEQLDDVVAAEPVTDETTAETEVDTDQPVDGEYAELDDIDQEAVDQKSEGVPDDIAADGLTAAHVEILLNRYKAGEPADPRLDELVKTHKLDELGREIREQGAEIRTKGKAIREDGGAIRREGAAVRAEGAELHHTSAGLRATGKSVTQQRLDRQFTAEHEQLKTQQVAVDGEPAKAAPAAGDSAAKPTGWLRRTWQKMLGRRDTVRDQLR